MVVRINRQGLRLAQIHFSNLVRWLRSVILTSDQPKEVCHEIQRQRPRPFLSSAAVSVAKDSPRRQTSSAATVSCTVTKSSSRSSDATIHVHAAQGVAFKRCCLNSGRYDGSNRNYFFPNLTLNLVCWNTEHSPRLIPEAWGIQAPPRLNRVQYPCVNPRCLIILALLSSQSFLFPTSTRAKWAFLRFPASTVPTSSHSLSALASVTLSEPLCLPEPQKRRRIDRKS